tara:strand:- start:1194 stop:1475 length:282 start_codon:yes stop_codon:yes gene_type:complete
MYVNLELYLNKNPKAKMGNLLAADIGGENNKTTGIVGYIERDMTSTNRENDILTPIMFDAGRPDSSLGVPLCEASGGGVWYLSDEGEITKMRN